MLVLLELSLIIFLLKTLDWTGSWLLGLKFLIIVFIERFYSKRHKGKMYHLVERGIVNNYVKAYGWNNKHGENHTCNK